MVSKGKCGMKVGNGVTQQRKIVCVKKALIRNREWQAVRGLHEETLIPTK